MTFMWDSFYVYQVALTENTCGFCIFFYKSDMEFHF